MKSISQNSAARLSGETLSKEEKSRYSRHILLPEVGLAGQNKLRKARVLLIGAGGLGSPAALYLAGAGVGTLGLVDFDQVEESNLQRQVLYRKRDVGRSKLASAGERIRDLNPGTEVKTHDTRIHRDNAQAIIAAYDVVVDGSDNFATRYLVNDCCVWSEKAYVYGSVAGFEGQVSVFDASRGPCYRCLFPVPPPPGAIANCAEGGILGVLPGLIGLIQATETLKLLLDLGTTLVGRLLLYDALAMKFQELRMHKDESCPVCGPSPTIVEPVDYEAFCGTSSAAAPGTDATREDGITVQELKSVRDAGISHLLLDVRTPGEAEICRIEGSRLLPLPELAQEARNLDPNLLTIVHCRSGVRSATAVRRLKELGFRRVKNLKGGILAWLDAYDPHQPKY